MKQSRRRQFFFGVFAPVANAVIGAVSDPSRAGRPALIVGQPRSGTTWVGKSIALAPEALFYNEPAVFVVDQTRHLYPEPNGHYPQITKLLDPAFGGMFAPNMLWHRDPSKLACRLFSQYRVVIKEVGSLFCTEWLATRYNCDVVLVVRHPCAVAASHQAFGWQLWPTLLLRNERLVAEYLAPFTELMRSAQSYWERAGAYWGAVQYVLKQFLMRYPEWLVIRYESLCSWPVEEFRRLYDALDLRWNECVMEGVLASSTGGAVEKRDRLNTLHTVRNSVAERNKWRRKLSPTQIEEVKRFVLPFDLPWYQADSDW